MSVVGGIVECSTLSIIRHDFLSHLFVCLGIMIPSSISKFSTHPWVLASPTLIQCCRVYSRPTYWMGMVMKITVVTLSKHYDTENEDEKKDEYQGVLSEVGEDRDDEGPTNVLLP